MVWSLASARSISRLHHKQSWDEAVDCLFFQVGYFDAKGNDLACDKDGKCHELRVRNAEQAMVLCQSYGKDCHGFVFAPRSGRLFLKTNVDAEPIHDPFLEFYVRVEFRGNLDLLEDTQCAVPVEEFQDSSQFKCSLPVLDPFNANIMKYIDKTNTMIVCQGEHFTAYSHGTLSLLRTGLLLILLQ
jgi:hypothetical protein